MEKLQQLKQWFYLLPIKEQRMVSGTVAVIILTLFYLIIWEPVHLGLDTAQQKQQSQKKVLLWMQDAALEVKALKASGGRNKIRDKNKPTTLIIEQTINNAGLKTSVSKLESSGKNGARVTLNDASFNQILVWLNTLATHNGVHVVSANFERTGSPGKTNTRLIFERP